MTDLPHRLRYYVDKFNSGYPVGFSNLCELMLEAAAALEETPPAPTVLYEGEAIAYTHGLNAELGLVGAGKLPVLGTKRVHVVITTLPESEAQS